MLSKRSLQLVKNFKISSSLTQVTDTAFEYSYQVYALDSANKPVLSERRVRATLIGRDREPFELLWKLTQESAADKTQAYDPVEKFKLERPNLFESLRRNVELVASGGEDFANLIWLRQRY